MSLQTPLCLKKEVCGSCSWSSIPYEEQLKRKLSEIITAATDSNIDLQTTSILPAVKTSHYRNRMDFIIDFKGNFGLREHGKWWKVIDDHTCFLPDEKIIDLYKQLYPWVKGCGLTYYDRKSYEGLLRYIVIRTTTVGETMVVVLTSVPINDSEEALIRTSLLSLAKQINPTGFVWSKTSSKSDISLGENTEIILGKEYIRECINGISYIIRPNSFFQTNPFTAEILQKYVIDQISNVNLTDGGSILDLYCGSGFFTLPLSKKFKNVAGVESVQSAIDDANENATINALNPKFICSTAESIQIMDFAPQVVLVDPPRAGLHPRVITDLLSFAPDYLIYVSCKYQKFIEEMGTLGTKYSILSSSAIDMFPHTPHVELVTVLKRH